MVEAIKDFCLVLFGGTLFILVVLGIGFSLHWVIMNVLGFSREGALVTIMFPALFGVIFAVIRFMDKRDIF